MLIGRVWPQSALQRRPPDVGSLTQLPRGLDALEATSRTWYGGRYLSSEYLGGRLVPNSRGFYAYPFEMLTCADSVAVFGVANRAVLEIVRESLGLIPGNEGPYRFEVFQLVERILDRKEDYWLSYVSAVMNTESSGLRRVTFSGMDVARAELFRSHLALFTPDSCGLRDRVSESELVRVYQGGHLALPGLRARRQRHPARSVVEERDAVEATLELLLRRYRSTSV